MGISPVQLIIILVIVALIFGTKKIRSMGGDIGGAIKGFKDEVKESEAPALSNSKATFSDKSSAKESSRPNV